MTVVQRKCRCLTDNPPPPLQAGTGFYFIGCFYSLPAFIFTIHAFASVPWVNTWGEGLFSIAGWLRAGAAYRGFQSTAREMHAFKDPTDLHHGPT